MGRSSSEPIPNRTAATSPSTPEESRKSDYRKDLEKTQKASAQIKGYEDHFGIQNNSALTAVESLEVDFNGTAGSSSGGTIEMNVIRDDNIELQNAMFEHSSEFKDFMEHYDGLHIIEKNCLLSFSVFPENEVMNKRFMIYWWIGEGFVRPPPSSRKTATEDFANEVFRQLVVKGFIEPVWENDCLEVCGCRLHPFVRAALILLAYREGFFDFDCWGNLTTGFNSLRACLMVGQELSDSPELDQIRTLFNVDATILDFEKPELFSKMRNVNVFSLGRWQISPKHHIEVEDTKFLDGLKNMKHLRFLSLRGISRITQLPGSISRLKKLKILDLRACHNLEFVPRGIGFLWSLTHLDISECYLLDDMPKELSSLSKLEVLKGFVVGNSKGRKTCTLKHLVKLPKLRKLGIYAGVKDFPRKADLEALQKFKALRNLKILWLGASQGKSDTTSEKGEEDAEQENGAMKFMEADFQNLNIASASDSAAPAAATRGISSARSSISRGDRATLPTQLEKLDLRCFSQPHAPNWLKASKLKRLKKLYIRGGKLCDLGQLEQERDQWDVEILRLKFLNELEMDWRELHELFPKLMFLKKDKCPKLTLFPCDEHGIWTRNSKNSER